MFLKMSMVMMVAILLLNVVHQADAGGEEKPSCKKKGESCTYTSNCCDGECRLSSGDQASNINIQDSSVLNDARRRGPRRYHCEGPSRKDQISAFLDEFFEKW